MPGRKEIPDFTGRLEDGAAYRICISGTEEEGFSCSILLDGQEYAVGDRKGIRLVVYDSLRGKVVDSVWLDAEASEAGFGR